MTQSLLVDEFGPSNLRRPFEPLTERSLKETYGRKEEESYILKVKGQ